MGNQNSRINKKGKEKIMRAISLIVVVAFTLSTVGCMEGMTREQKTAVGGAVVDDI